jgi:hypothetical protein
MMSIMGMTLITTATIVIITIIITITIITTIITAAHALDMASAFMAVSAHTMGIIPTIIHGIITAPNIMGTTGDHIPITTSITLIPITEMATTAVRAVKLSGTRITGQGQTVKPTTYVPGYMLRVIQAVTVSELILPVRKGSPGDLRIKTPQLTAHPSPQETAAGLPGEMMEIRAL